MKTRQFLISALFACVAALTAHSSFALSKGEPKPEPTESQLVEHGRYTNKRGESVHSPAHTKNGLIPVGASAKCGDGTYSFSHSHRGTCSRHGGVSGWLD